MVVVVVGEGSPLWRHGRPQYFFVIIASHGLEKDSKPKENKQDDTLFPLTAQGRPSSSSSFLQEQRTTIMASG